jgi:Flp pilus assembly protein TadG
MVEFALGALLMTLVFGGVFQFGYTFYQYNLLKNAVMDGAHYASMATYDSNSCTPASDFQTAVQNMVVYGNPGGAGNPISPGLATSNIVVSPSCVNGVPTSMTVSITGYSIGAVFGTTTLTNKPSATYPYQGIDSPL